MREDRRLFLLKLWHEAGQLRLELREEGVELSRYFADFQALVRHLEAQSTEHSQKDRGGSA